jgi:hypothetical protein
MKLDRLRLKGIRFLFTAGLALLVFGASAFAGTLELRLTDSETGASVIVQDTLGTGMVSYNGRVGNFSVNVTTGLSKPVLGTLGQGHMDLNSVNVSCLGVQTVCNGVRQQQPDTLKIELSDINFPGNTGGVFSAKVGGTLGAPGSSVLFGTWLDSGNVLFGHGSAPTDPSFAFPFTYSACFGCFSASGSKTVGPLGLYSMTLEADITNPQGIVNDSFDFDVTNTTPEPSTAILLGAGLFGLGIATRRRLASRPL